MREEEISHPISGTSTRDARLRKPALMMESRVGKYGVGHRDNDGMPRLKQVCDGDRVDVLGSVNTLIASAHPPGRIAYLSHPHTAKFRSAPITLCMKHISALLSLIAVLSFASCAHHGPATHTTQTTTTAGYTK